jgi:hypothetical protein
VDLHQVHDRLLSHLFLRVFALSTGNSQGSILHDLAVFALLMLLIVECTHVIGLLLHRELLSLAAFFLAKVDSSVKEGVAHWRLLVAESLGSLTISSVHLLLLLSMISGLLLVVLLRSEITCLLRLQAENLWLLQRVLLVALEDLELVLGKLEVVGGVY